MIPEFKNMPYPNRLGLFSLETEHFRLYLIQVFRIFNSTDDIGFKKHFTKSLYKPIKGYPLKLQLNCPNMKTNLSYSLKAVNK